MKHRLSRITTRTGDQGTTGLGDGTRISKDSLRIHALGEVDELNSCLGVLLCEPLPEEVRTLLTRIQHDLFDLGGELCVPGSTLLKEESLAQLDEAIAHHNATLPPLREFILPGGTRPAAEAHVCRAVARRAERGVVMLAADEPMGPRPVQYLNRLSDLLFVLARVLNRQEGGGETLWKR